jgi:hypothetical protein
MLLSPTTTVLDAPVLVLGHKEHGKGTFTDLLASVHSLSGISSSDYSNEFIVFPALKEKYGYNTPEECYADRRSSDEIRSEWFQLIAGFNALDGTSLARAILKNYIVYDGMRNDLELESCIEQQIFKTVFWVDAAQRKPLESEQSMKIKYDPSYMIFVDNNGPKENLLPYVQQLNFSE